MRAIAELPPVRRDPFQEDVEADGRLVETLGQLWSAQDMALRPRDRTIEEVIRFIGNQQYVMWSDVLQRFVDHTEYLTEEELKWLPLPKLNRMLPWYMLSLSRLTENPPTWTTQPASADLIDADQAEVWDVVLKTQWREMNAPSQLVAAMQWVVGGGLGFLKFRVDYKAGKLLDPVEGPAVMSMDGPDGVPIERYLDRAPYDESGQPLVAPAGDGSDEFEQTGEGYQEREGEIQCDALSPFEVRSEWNHARPWHQRTWHTHRALMTVSQLYELTGVEVEPDLTAADVEHGQEFLRLAFGSGSYSQPMPWGFDGSAVHVPEDLVILDEHWRAPSDIEGTPCTDDSPGGRFVLYLPRRKRVLIDAERPAKLPYTSPIHKLGFVGVPGRPADTTVGEALVPLQRAINRGAQQIIAYRDKVSQPIEIVDKGSGLAHIPRKNRPGERLVVRIRPGVQPITYVVPPPASADTWKSLDLLMNEFDRLAGLAGQIGGPPTRDPSGELIKELRETSDRYYGATARANVEEIARMQETVIELIKVAWSTQRIIAYAGEDKIHRTMIAIPEMMKRSRVNIVPDVESMLPEGRGEKQQKVDQRYQMGLYGPPGTPAALSQYAEASKVPHSHRMAMPGEVHRVREQRELGFLLQGGAAADLDFFPWYNDEIALEVFESFMSRHEFTKLDDAVKTQIIAHYLLHQARFQQQQMEQMQMQMQQAAMAAGGAGGGGGGPPPGGGSPPATPAGANLSAVA